MLYAAEHTFVIIVSTYSSWTESWVLDVASCYVILWRWLRIDFGVKWNLLGMIVTRISRNIVPAQLSMLAAGVRVFTLAFSSFFFFVNIDLMMAFWGRN